MTLENPKAKTPENKSESSHEKIDRHSPDIVNALKEAAIYKKMGTVTARRAEAGEEIVTVMKDGKTETTNTAKEGQWVVTNPDGEQYIISDEKFQSRYEPGTVDGTYNATGFVRAIQNPFNKPVEIMASWGTPQMGDADCMFAVLCDAQGNITEVEPYIIAPAEFGKTYSMF